jgi:hypothetical protein
MCVGSQIACGNQNITCEVNQRLNYATPCVPGSTCNVATCCRACTATNLVTNGAFTSSANWTFTGGITWQSSTANAAAGVGAAQTTGSLSQAVCWSILTYDNGFLMWLHLAYLAF